MSLFPRINSSPPLASCRLRETDSCVSLKTPSLHSGLTRLGRVWGPGSRVRIRPPSPARRFHSNQLTTSRARLEKSPLGRGLRRNSSSRLPSAPPPTATPKALFRVFTVLTLARKRSVMSTAIATHTAARSRSAHVSSRRPQQEPGRSLRDVPFSHSSAWELWAEKKGSALRRVPRRVEKGSGLLSECGISTPGGDMSVSAAVSPRCKLTASSDARKLPGALRTWVQGKTMKPERSLP